MEKEVGGLGCPREVGADPGEASVFRTNEGPDPWRKGDLRWRRAVRAGIGIGPWEEHFFLFLSPEDVAPTPRLGTQASVLMWPH